jgi:hypothetical protein
LESLQAHRHWQARHSANSDQWQHQELALENLAQCWHLSDLEAGRLNRQVRWLFCAFSGAVVVRRHRYAYGSEHHLVAFCRIAWIRLMRAFSSRRHLTPAGSLRRQTRPAPAFGFHSEECCYQMNHLANQSRSTFGCAWLVHRQSLIVAQRRSKN